MTSTNSLKTFFGREGELSRLQKISQLPGSRIIVVYGRRRVGKTTLIHKAFNDRNLIKFEGLEGKSEVEQRQHFLEQLADHTEDYKKLYKEKIQSWKDLFMLLAGYYSSKKVTLYFEELQWMADYKDDLISELKFVWDNYLQHNKDLILVLCGSSPSFIINSVLHSKALYNRSQHEFPIGELDLISSGKILGKNKSQQEILDGYLLVGGIPEYFKYLSTGSSVYLSMLEESFTKGGFFVNEADRVFVSTLAKYAIYKQIIEYIAINPHKTRKQITTALKAKSGGMLSSIFNDLQKCAFIESYGPLSLGATSRESKLFLRDPYLNFYYSFIEPQLPQISRGDFDRNQTKAITHTQYRQWLGYAFEHFCLAHHTQIAKVLGFSAVKYNVGPFYQRKSEDSSGAQLDLVFERSDKVLTVCEIKYTELPTSEKIIPEFERKLSVLSLKKKYTVQKVLLNPNGATKELRARGYFDQIIDLERLFSGFGE